MKERIKELRVSLGLTQQEFADRVGMKRDAYAKYETGANNPSSAAVSLICRTFGINEVWLRTGVGEMFHSRSREEEIAAFFGDVLSDRAPEVQRRLVSVLAKLPVEAWGFVEDLCQRIADEWAEKEKDPAEGQGRE